jgi:8-oxo-dGTP pyrophosphatase MutT (NUDIX family)
MKTRRQVSAGGVLVRRKGADTEVLLAARRTRRGEVLWGLPKGLVEKGESLEDAAIREVQEETGFLGEVRTPLGKVSYWFVWEGTRVNKTVHFFLMEATGGDASLRDMEMEDVDWFPLAEAAEVVGFDSEREVIRKAAQLE